MTPCDNQIARSIALECTNPLNPGSKGRAVYIPISAIKELTPDANNPRVISAVVLKEDAKVVAINNASSQQGFAGSTTTGNADAGRPRYTKVFAFLVPLRGADVSKDLIEPIVNNEEGGIIITQKNDKRGLGSFEVIGLQSPVKIDPASVTRDEYANGGAWAMSATCTEDFSECNLYAENYETTKAIFDELYYEKSF